MNIAQPFFTAGWSGISGKHEKQSNFQANAHQEIDVIDSYTPSRRPAARRGLTLIELVVVLTILVALGGLLVPIIGNVLTRSHVATCSSNIPEIASMLLRKDALQGTFGDNWSTGIETGAAATTSVNGNAIGTLSAGEIEALDAAGITTVYDHELETNATVFTATNPYDVTFNNEAVEETITGTTQVITLTQAQLDGLNVTATVADGDRYIWLGIDKDWTGLGVDMPEPPVHFGDTPGFFPDEVYSRFGAIFQVGQSDGAATPATEALGRARFVMVTYSLDGDAFETADNHIAIHWQEVDNN
ncbi:MAG: prepilin-type N-terminal cleavage/methylation domain-containing protein [Planctomycetota bacterium]